MRKQDSTRRRLAFILAFLLTLPLPAYRLFTPSRSQSSSSQARTSREQTTAGTALFPTVSAASYSEAPTSIDNRSAPVYGPIASGSIHREPILLETTISQHASADALPQTATAQVSREFSIEIPAIGLSQTVVEDVDPTDKSEYLGVLTHAVAHGYGTAVPSEPDGNTYLFAHSRARFDGSTPAGGWFTRIDELATGDVMFIGYRGTVYTYTVVSKEVVLPAETSVYTADSLFPGHSSLTLQTCYPRGDTAKRLLVYAIGE